MLSISEPRVPGTAVRQDTVAVLAAGWGQRLRALPLFFQRNYVLFTMGGAPAALGLVMEHLEALASTNKQAIWDAAYLPILASLQIPIVVEGGTSVGVRDYLFWASGSRGERSQSDACSPVRRWRNPIIVGQIEQMLRYSIGQADKADAADTKDRPDPSARHSIERELVERTLQAFLDLGPTE